MIEATTDELLDYLSDVIYRAERYGALVKPGPQSGPQSDSNDEIEWEREGMDLVLDVVVLPPVSRGARVEIALQERWQPVGQERWQLAEYGYDLRDFQVGYRRALHQHDQDYFVNQFGVATHEHCEAVMGRETCEHYAGTPCRGALDGLERLCSVWLAGKPPDCSELRCLDS